MNLKLLSRNQDACWRRPQFPRAAWKTQAKYLAQSFAIARKNPRIQMMIWFLVKDESRLAGWQSGFFTAAGKRKPSYFTFRAMKH